MILNCIFPCLNYKQRSYSGNYIANIKIFTDEGTIQENDEALGGGRMYNRDQRKPFQQSGAPIGTRF